MSERPGAVDWLRGIAGAIAGGALGHFLFMYILAQGFYALILPGAALGVGCGLLSRVQSNGLGVLCGLSAVLLGLFSEWRFLPFREDGSLTFFVMNLHDLQPLTLVMVAIGGVIGFWFGRGR